MNLWNLMPVRNEEWCLGICLRAVLQWCDGVVVLLHRCTDASADIAWQVHQENPGRVRILTSDDSMWHEMSHRQMLLEEARRQGATHIATVDADEILTGNLLPTIREIIKAAPDTSIVQPRWICLRKSMVHYERTGTWGNAFASTAFKDRPEYHWTQRKGYDFHHRHPFNSNYFHRVIEDGGLFHLQFVVDRRLRAKQALYVLTELQRWPDREPLAQMNAKYARAVYETGPLAKVPDSWWKPYEKLFDHLILDDSEPPWQELEAKRLIGILKRQFPIKTLDLFGVTE